MTSKILEFQYEENPCVRGIRSRIHYCIESISLKFEDYEDDHTKGPGMYIAIVSNRSVREFAEPMGANNWPTGLCQNMCEDVDTFYEAASTVAHSRDGGVCISVDGTILEQMVRFKNVRDEDLPENVRVTALEYADWMGARHMSAYETSLRPEVLTTITLSEETGRITVFQDGGYKTTTRDKIGEPWREQHLS